MDKTKAVAAYKDLVDSVRNDYLVNPRKNKRESIVLNWCDESEDNTELCREINLWTYWQGRGYANETPEIDYLLVGQDWGNPDLEKNRDCLQRIRRINAGETDVPYIIEGDSEQYATDLNLAILFQELGLGKSKEESIINKRYPNLFFTNFCLGYRHGDQIETGKMTKKLMNFDKEYFVKLAKVLRPKHILCLGKLTFECVYEALSGLKAANLEHFKDDYNIFLEKQNGFEVVSEDLAVKVFPLAHCGAVGTMNRNKIRDDKRKLITDPDLDKTDPLSKQKADWRKAII